MYHKLFVGLLTIVLLLCGASPVWYAVVWGVFSILVFASFAVHRRLFREMLAANGLTLVRLYLFDSTFVLWSDPPVWWEWRTVYSVRVRAADGRELRASCCIRGPFFALFSQRCWYHLVDELSQGVGDD